MGKPVLARLQMCVGVAPAQAGLLGLRPLFLYPLPFSLNTSQLVLQNP